MTEKVQSGLNFTLVNVKSGTVLDLSGTDNRTVSGWPSNGGNNQKWTVAWVGNGWTFRSIYTGLFLGVDGNPADGTRLVGQTTPTTWHIWHDTIDPTKYRVFAPNTSYNLDLYAQGDSAPGTPVTLWWTWNGTHQTWDFQQAE
ncbi:ricin B-like lectin [Cyathus striatus]|nr:ricin B-like lectin [Cyathus striatus]